MVYDPDDFGDDDDGIDDLFTDRLSESAAFAAALSAHRRRLDSREEDSPRGRNVLVFHGLGGIGKSELSRRLEAWAKGALPGEVGWGPAPSTRVDATARIDLHGTLGHIDGAERLAELRTQVGVLKPRWPVFDVAFAAYWAATHPMASLPVTSPDGDAAFVTPALDTLKDLAEDLDSSATLASLGAGLAKHLVSGIAARFQRRLGVAPPRGYDELFLRLATEPTPDDPKPDLLGRLAALLRWEIDHSAQAVPLVVVFIDTFERLNLDHRRESESLLNQIAYAMPSTLFVVTGRDRLTWWQLDGRSLRWRGPTIWPLLVHGATAEPTQHALDYLSAHDRRVLLRRIRDQLDLPMTDAVLDDIAEQSGGLPEYIRLAKEAALTRKNNGVEITADAVTGSLEELVLRLFEDVPSEQEQAAVRAAALFLRCTPELVAATAGLTDAAARSALMRPLFESVDGARDTFTMHDRVRTAIRDAPPSTRGGWSDGDWSAAGTRALVHLRDELAAAKARYDTALAANAATDAADVATEILRLTGLAISVVCEVSAHIDTVDSPGYEDWVSEALVKGPSIAGLRPFVPGTSRTPLGRDILDFIEAKTRGIPLEQRTALLRRLLETSPGLGWIAGRHLAYALANASEWDAAIAVFDELLRQRPGNEFILYQRTLRLHTARRFRQAQAAMSALPDQRRTSLRARVRFAHGEPDEWLGWALDRVTDRRSSGIIKDALEIEGVAVRWHALIRGHVPGLDAAALRNQAQATGHDAAARDALVAAALLDGDLDDVDLHWLTSVDRDRNEEEIGFREATVRAALATVRDDRLALEGLHHEITARRQARGNNWVPVEFLLGSHGLPLDEPSGTEWVDPRMDVAVRWGAIWERWLERVRSGGARAFLGASQQPDH